MPPSAVAAPEPAHPTVEAAIAPPRQPSPERPAAPKPPPAATPAFTLPPLGPLPAGEAAWRHYAVHAGAEDGRPMIAIVIDDMGLDRKHS
ncbi:MAG: hypothetical protein WDN69_33305 [Aliidongia sp.]